MKIAIEGCMHGDLDKVYQTLKLIESQNGTKIDLLLCCGDFQAVRNERDMESLNVPLKFREMKSFWKYYSGREIAPVPTIFIGGNHEASNYLWELYYGGYVAPNIYFLGFAGVIKFGNIRIGGLSGIYNARNYRTGHHERAPYNESSIRSVYHVREYDVHKLMQVEEPIDIFLSHDWPVGITDCGNWKQLVRYKPYFEKEIQEKTLGSKAAAQLLEKLRPAYWFSAHLHCKFSAVVQHGEGGPLTKFLALDKCLPRRKFLQVIEIESEPGPYEIQYDEEWLAITRKFNSIFPLTFKNANFGATQLEMEDCRQLVSSRLRERGTKPFEFTQTAPPFDPTQSDPNGSFSGCPRNPQTESLLQLLELPYLLDSTSESREGRYSPSAAQLIERVRSASSSDPTIPGKLLRLVFHDCFVEGCDASVLLQGNGTERSDPGNRSLGGFQVIDSAKRMLEIFCPGTVSCADVVALAARDAVAITGGPLLQIPTGRRDGRVSAAANVRPNIIDTTFTINEMINIFTAKGLSLEDLVVLSGAHTIGSAHCSAFSDRFREDSKGKLTLIDTSLDRNYANELMQRCPVDASASVTVVNDPGTSSSFDNQYYRNLVAHKGLFQSDSVLLDDKRTRNLVEDFANDQEKFFQRWSQSFLKLTSIGVKTGEEGEIRQSCSVISG